jgi:hypothetical protein
MGYFLLTTFIEYFENCPHGVWVKRLLGLWFDSPLLATILATGGISIFGDSSL